VTWSHSSVQKKQTSPPWGQILSKIPKGGKGNRGQMPHICRGPPLGLTAIAALSLMLLHRIIVYCNTQRCYAFVFTPFSSLCSKLVMCNKQGLNGVSLLSLLKLWVVVLNYKWPNKCVFLPFYGLVCDNLEFL